MMELIRSWLVGITCAAMVVALAEALTPEGTVRKIGRLTGGLILLLAIVNPVIRVDQSALTRAFSEYDDAWNGGEVSLEETDDALMKAIIAEQTSAYILDKAAALGIACRVEVDVREVEGCPVPVSVTVYGTPGREERVALTRQIEADLAIPAERQTYQREDVE